MNLDLKSKQLLDMFSDEAEDIEYVKKQLEKGKYTLLPKNVSIGDVYKIAYGGNIDVYGYEKSYLYLPSGSGINEHVHNASIERYTLVCGVMNINGEECTQSDCLFGESHCVDVVPEDTIIKTLKIKDDLVLSADICTSVNKRKTYTK